MSAPYVVEGFDWCGSTIPGDISTFLTRYNQPQASGGSQIAPGAGRFVGNALSLGGGGFTQQLIIPNGPIAAPPVIRMGFAVKATNWATPGLLMGFGDSGSGLSGGHQNLYMGVGPTAANRIAILAPPINLFNQGTVKATGLVPLLNGSYYYIEMELVIGAAGSVNVYIDGVLDSSVSGIDTRGIGPLSGDVYSFYLCSPQAGGSFYFDDGYVGPNLLGPRRVITNLPNVDGPVLQFTPSAGLTQYNLVNEVPPDGDATFISSSTPGDVSLFGVAGLPYNPAQISGVQIAFYARRDDLAARTIAGQIRSGVTDQTGITLTPLANNYADLFLQVFDLDPATGLPWTAAGRAAAFFGVKLIS